MKYFQMRAYVFLLSAVVWVGCIVGTIKYRRRLRRNRVEPDAPSYVYVLGFALLFAIGVVAAYGVLYSIMWPMH